MKNMILPLVIALVAGCVEAEGIDVEINTEPVTEYTAGNLVATDALGRSLPDYREAGGQKKDKFVALFYWTWHTQLSQGRQVGNVREILEQYPEAINEFNHPAWNGQDTFFWDEPLFGYYTSTDKWVIRKHAEMLAEAGVDAIAFDCTNGSFTWEESYLALCEVFSEAMADGVKVPQIFFMLAFSPTVESGTALEELYTKFYEPGKYSDLWFKWAGKPFIMAYPEVARTDEVAEFFTFRAPWGTYHDAGPREDNWGWLQINPQHGFGPKSNGLYEMTTVGAAQNYSKERGVTAMNAAGVFGRSYTNARGHSSDPDAVNYGLNFQEQWEHALGINPDLVFITGWNEWLAGKFADWGGEPIAFPDQFSQEYSRDIEPMVGGHGDNYYYQMISNIRRFKGIAEPTRAPYSDRIETSGSFAAWEELPAFESYPGNTRHRSHAGWPPMFYTNTTGRNDIVRSKVAYDEDNVYFYVETATTLSSETDPHWMMLFINVDRSHETGWEGYDFVVNRRSPAGGKAILERSTSGWAWSEAGQVDYSVRNNMLAIAIPRSSLGVTDRIELEFKWVDNMQREGDIMDFYVSGDAAPLGRFNYLFIE